MHRERVLIVEGERETCGVLRNYLADKGYEVSTADTCAVTEQIWRSRRPDIAIVDYSLADGNALGLIPRLNTIDASIPIIILTGYGSIDFAVEAVKLGAAAFLPKPAELSTLEVLIQRNLENQRNHRQQLAEKTWGSRESMNPFVGKSESIRRLADQAHKIAATDNPILIQGEIGTCKGTIARWLHRNGPMASEAFVEVHCGNSAIELRERELCGYDGHAVDEPPEHSVGLLEVAHNGTVFFDEIENADLQMQVKIFRFVEEKQFRKIEEVTERRADIRLIAAAQRAIATPVLRKSFRGDFYDRINWVFLSVPPLRERVEDIPALSADILGQLAAELGISRLEIGDHALRALQGYSWPGNVRELRNVLERIALVTGRDRLTDQQFFDAQVEQYISEIGQFRTLEQVERSYIQHVVRQERGRVESAAKKLGIPRSSLYHKLKQYKTDQPGTMIRTVETTGPRRSRRAPHI